MSSSCMRWLDTESGHCPRRLSLQGASLCRNYLRDDDHIGANQEIFLGCRCPWRSVEAPQWAFIADAMYEWIVHGSVNARLLPAGCDNYGIYRVGVRER